MKPRQPAEHACPRPGAKSRTPAGAGGEDEGRWTNGFDPFLLRKAGSLCLRLRSWNG